MGSFRVIALDGPSGSGKSTIAKLLAERLGFSYLDTGALYRAVALLFHEKGIGPGADDGVLAGALSAAGIKFCNGKVMLGGRDVSDAIRDPEIGQSSSVFSARKVVREALMVLQREAALQDDLVVEGRDTTTVVFPHAWKKFYMEASVAVRAGRRYRQLRQMGIDVTPELAERDVAVRDARDKERDIAPLKKAADAVIIDTTDKNIDELMEEILGIIRSDP